MYNDLAEEITKKIFHYLKEKYKTLMKHDSPQPSISVNINYDFNLGIIISPHYDSNVFDILMHINGTMHRLQNITSESNYLEEIEKVIGNLQNQIQIYEDFIKDFSDHIKEWYNYDYMINLNTCTMYIKNNDNNSKAVIYPSLDILQKHNSNYVTMYINSIEGGFPMKIYSSISFEDAGEMLEFFL